MHKRTGRFGVALTLFVTLGACSPSAVERIRARPAAEIEASLPAEPFGPWVEAQLAPGLIRWVERPCGAQRCVAVDAERSNGIHVGIVVTIEPDGAPPQVVQRYLRDSYEPSEVRTFRTTEAWLLAVEGLAPRP